MLPRTSARRIFEITTLDRALPLAASLEDALTELGPTQTDRASSTRPFRA